MLKRAAFVGLAALVLGTSSAHAERILNYEVEIRGQEDGTLLVHETILYDFGGRKGTGIDRRISLFLHIRPWLTHRPSLRLLDARADMAVLPLPDWYEGGGVGAFMCDLERPGEVLAQRWNALVSPPTGVSG